MEHYPALDIRFPPERENELHAAMIASAQAPWSPKDTDALDRPIEAGSYYFHRNVVDGAASCTLCIRREKPGHWVVQNIVPDEGQPAQIPLDQYKLLLREFDSLIAEPATNAVNGVSAIEFSQFRLEDYFSPRTVKLLEAFCGAANQADLGSHPCDQERWLRFLISAYDDGHSVHCDIFGNCLRTANWWPDHGVPVLVHEYDFAMRLLQQSGRRSPQPR